MACHGTPGASRWFASIGEVRPCKIFPVRGQTVQKMSGRVAEGIAVGRLDAPITWVIACHTWTIGWPARRYRAESDTVIAGQTVV
jgi:hypothetical protein